MTKPYSWIPGSSLGFFDEGGEFAGEDVDLMGFDFDEEQAHGMTEKIVSGARQALADAPPEFARASLRMVDLFLEETADELKIVGRDGAQIFFKDVNPKQLNQLDFMPLIVHTLDKMSLAIGDEEHDVEGTDVTPAKFCAAFALRMVFNATREYLRHASDLREYYLMQAAVAYGLMQSFTRSGGVSEVLVSAVKRDAAKTAAIARWDRDPTRPMWAAVRKEWDRWQSDRSLYRYPRDFRRAMQLKFPELVDGTLKNRMSEWGRGNS